MDVGLNLSTVFVLVFGAISIATRNAADEAGADLLVVRLLLLLLLLSSIVVGLVSVSFIVLFGCRHSDDETLFLPPLRF